MLNADTILFLLFVAFFLFMIWQQMQEAKRHPNKARYRRNDGNVIVIPGGWGGSGSWPSGGGWSSGGGGGEVAGPAAAATSAAAVRQVSW